MAQRIDWGFLEGKFGAVYLDGPGSPPLPTRLMDPEIQREPPGPAAVRGLGREPVFSVFLRRGILPAQARL